MKKAYVSLPWCLLVFFVLPIVWRASWHPTCPNCVGFLIFLTWFRRRSDTMELSTFVDVSLKIVSSRFDNSCTHSASQKIKSQKCRFYSFILILLHLSCNKRFMILFFFLFTSLFFAILLFSFLIVPNHIPVHTYQCIVPATTRALITETKTGTILCATWENGKRYSQSCP